MSEPTHQERETCHEELEHIQPGEKFFERNKDSIIELLRVLGHEDIVEEDPETVAVFANEAWVGVEHGKINSVYSEEQAEAALPLFDKMDLISETLPPEGVHYDQAVIIGGTTTANHRRGVMLAKAEDEHDNRFDEIIYTTYAPPPK